MPLEMLERPERRLRLVVRRALRVVDVALFYGERSGGIRTYLREKQAFAAECEQIEHHLLVPGAVGPTVPFNHANGYRLPLGGRGLLQALDHLEPDVVLLHDPFWKAREVCRLVHLHGGAVVMVHHGSAALDAAALPGPSPVYERALRGWLRRTYDEVDAVMAACDPFEDTGRPASFPLRFGLNPAFRPHPGVTRGDHVLYAGRIAREKGIFTLLEAAAQSREPWPLHVVGSGPARPAVVARARELGLRDRLRVLPYLADPRALARAYAAARCVVMPGPLETFGLVAFEAAACAAPVVACRTAPSAAISGAHTFSPGHAGELSRAIERARQATPDPAAAAAYAARHTWERALTAELRDLEALTGW